MKANRVEKMLVSMDHEDVAKHPRPGDFEPLPRMGEPGHMMICCPGCGNVLALAMSESGSGPSPSWKWDGDKDKPTLTPSIWHSGCWHGFLTAGEFVSC
jgi:hypothetical protein